MQHRVEMLSDHSTALSEKEMLAVSRLRRPLFDPIRMEGDTIVEGITNSLRYVHGTLLDLGCGASPYARLLEDRISTYIGADLRPNLEMPPTVCSNCLALPFKEGSFDSVLCTQVLEHVSNPFTTMSEIHRVLRVGGYAVLTMPALWPLHEEPYDFFRYTKYGLEELARISNLQVVEIRERGGAFTAIAQLIGAVLYDELGKKSVTRLPFKILFMPFLALCKLLDSVFPYSKLTLGYTMVVQKV